MPGLTFSNELISRDEVCEQVRYYTCAKCTNEYKLTICEDDSAMLNGKLK